MCTLLVQYSYAWHFISLSINKYYDIKMHNEREGPSMQELTTRITCTGSIEKGTHDDVLCVVTCMPRESELKASLVTTQTLVPYSNSTEGRRLLRNLKKAS